jgi:hypothetical protein
MQVHCVGEKHSLHFQVWGTYTYNCAYKVKLICNSMQKAVTQIITSGCNADLKTVE